jgi:hypothetical protein
VSTATRILSVMGITDGRGLVVYTGCAYILTGGSLALRLCPRGDGGHGGLVLVRCMPTVRVFPVLQLHKRRRGSLWRGLLRSEGCKRAGGWRCMSKEGGSQ